jgi:hypothetical protein
MSKRRGLMAVLSAAICVIAMTAAAAQAATPAPGYTQFTGCPSPAEHPGLEYCIHSEITSGNFKMGSKNVPITNPIVLTGGALSNGDIIANSQGGLRPAKQKVPGGVIGLTGLTWLAELLGSEALTLYAVTEAVGTPNLGSVLKLPIRVHLINSVLGNSCYVGSPSNPITLNLTTGTTSPPLPNHPITGNEGSFSFNGTTGIASLTGATFVDNSFSAPAASGCTLTLFGFIPIDLDGLVDLQAGLPAKAGTNETVQNTNNELVNQSIAYP